MQDHSGLKISEAKYVQSGHHKKHEKRRVHKTQRIVSTIALMLCFAFLVFGSVQVVSAHTSAFQIMVEGEAMATLPTEKEAKAAVAYYLQEQTELLGYNVVCDDAVKIEKISSRDAVYSSIKDATAALDGVVNVLAKAVAVCVNGQPVMHVANEAVARDALELVRSEYREDGIMDDDINTLEQISVMASNVLPEQICNVWEAANMLLYGKTEVQRHYIETEGETFEYIANRYSLQVDDIKQANPAVDPTNMAVGEAILLTQFKPLISVQIKRMVVSREETPFETELRDSSDLPRGVSVVIEEGAPGENEVTTEVIERNGVVVAQNRVSSVSVVDPVTKVVERGVRMTVAVNRSAAATVNLGNGTLGWPSNGDISSRYGYRSMGYHSGLDIASPMGSPVVAAEFGTVVFAQYQGSYGNLVKIDHGGGLETWYSHLQAYAVSVGSKVERGDMVGTVGRTGRTTGPHVHFEVRVNGAHCNPLLFLGARSKVAVDTSQAELIQPDEITDEPEEDTLIEEEELAEEFDLSEDEIPLDIEPPVIE
ncbi:MAG: peptidoglycan DD-metalloendopeptidase family protein [Clostridiales bacterium]|nr:peptidoglycan DD-metalloendopeptidase family protein [Clostridiales bacterium]